MNPAHDIRGGAIPLQGDEIVLIAAYNRGTNLGFALPARLKAPGLQARMTVSYVLVTAAAVVLVEALAIGFVLPNLLSALDLQNRVTATAKDYTAEIVTTSTSPDAIILPAGFVLGHSGSTGEAGQVQSLDSGVLIPQVTGTFPDRAPMALALVLATDGRVLSSSYPGRFPVGASAYSLIPNLDLGRAGVGGQTSTLGDGRVASAIEPIFLTALRAKGASPDTKTTFAKPQAQGYVYVQAPLQTTLGTTLATAGPLLQSGLLLLLLTLPVGALFGLLTTRGLVRRLRRLESTTLAFAEGDLSRRVVPSGSDEVGQLEDHFNQMAERLTAAIARERSLAEDNARLAERSRISRELHDSISQDLFSINLIQRGLEKATPADSPLQPQLGTMGETVSTALQEMRALLLELRPNGLGEKGLAASLEQLCANYESRAAIVVKRQIQPVDLAPAAEDAVYRVAQEALANAVKHAQAHHLELTLRQQDGSVDLMVVDDGRGFDPDHPEQPGLGLKLMRERMDELGGRLTITSIVGKGTQVVAAVPLTAEAKARS